VHVARLEIEPELVTVPAGPFTMGISEEQALALAEHFEWAVEFGMGYQTPTFASERPQHQVTLPEYAIGRYPVTNAEYRVFVEASGHVPPKHWHEGRMPEEEADHPLRLVTWYDARTYSGWLRERTGQEYRLPSEAEWEKAARGSGGRLWPWGDEWDAGRVRWQVTAPPVTSPVGSHSPAGDSPYGCADMAGNVAEWCSSEMKKYPYRAGDGREKPWRETRVRKQRKKLLVIRGGGWNAQHAGYLLCVTRVGAYPDSAFEAGGFRLARGPGP
jgi:formylglycine-generating enzyme required for sulfatase activity